MAEKIVFEDSWQHVFAEFGLNCFDDFFNFSGGERINKNNKRNVQTLTFGDGSARKVFFMKRFSYPHLKDMLFTWRNFGRAVSQAQCEWENANILLKNGIKTYQPVCYGERTNLGIETKSFFITKELQSQCLTDFLAQNWVNLSQSQKEKVIASLAKVIRKVHDAGISLPDLYVWHIFLSETENGDYEFAVIDLHRMSHNVKNKNKKLKNLGRFTHSMTGKYFDDNMRQLFVKSYAGTDWQGNINTLITKVEKYAAAVSAKRNPKPY